MELDGLIKVRQGAPLLKYSLKTVGKNGLERLSVGKVVERIESIGVTRRSKHQYSSMELEGLIQIRQCALLLESVMEAVRKFLQRRISIEMIRGTERQCNLMVLDGLIKVEHNVVLLASILKVICKVTKLFYRDRLQFTHNTIECLTDKCKIN
ncbi:uncharacterized protein BJ212DRAFT_1298715 [Suillus subaureus]|uniref:Uncharacterized protein n=1 Tax=Suillus subaureus TaxID=48587 RepID=A0A9P7JEL5_9AGAM|nr:uncharacterized protein BJ212DRAFT_1298715 [Suillus subaureus]KAG1818654.1 hypothetical protein BJ212DRAFT_1298715 [Suillus subaureus]